MVTGAVVSESAASDPSVLCSARYCAWLTEAYLGRLTGALCAVRGAEGVGVVVAFTVVAEAAGALAATGLAVTGEVLAFSVTEVSLVIGLSPTGVVLVFSDAADEEVLVALAASACLRISIWAFAASARSFASCAADWSFHQICERILKRENNIVEKVFQLVIFVCMNRQMRKN